MNESKSQIKRQAMQDPLWAAEEIVRLQAEIHRSHIVITDQQVEIAALREPLHTCHADCSKAGCVNRRLRKLLTEAIDHSTSSFDGLLTWEQRVRAALNQENGNG